MPTTSISQLTEPDQVVKAYRNLSSAHARELVESAIPADVAADQGVYSARSRGDLPTWAQWVADCEGALPAIVYPMLHPDGSETGQVKPGRGSVSTRDGRVLKYVSPSKDSNPPKLPVLREVDDPSVLLIVEGVKQALAALSWAPDDWAIYRIAGIWSWRESSGDDSPGTPSTQLRAVQGKNVVIVPDADARTNSRVYDGAVELGEACEAFGALSVRFARVPGAGKDGIDDVLSRIPSRSDRCNMLQAWVRTAKTKPADLDKRELNQLRRAEKAKSVARAADAKMAREADDRVQIDVGGDMHEASLALLAELIRTKGGTRIFQRENGLVRVQRDRTDRALATPLSRSGLRRELLEVVYPYASGNQGPAPMPLSDNLVDLVADHYGELPELTGIGRTPIVRSDGAVITRSGFDPDSGVLLDLDPDVQNIEVPEHPSDADIADARRLIRDDLFAMDGTDGFDGWVFASEADQTHAIAGLITPVVRSAVEKSPILAFDGLQRGVGKGECVNVIHSINFGTTPPVQSAPRSDTEMDKRLTAKARAGSDVLLLDEVQNADGSSRLDSHSLAAFVTSKCYEARKLGTSEVISAPNVMTIYATGNNLQIPGDMARRVYTSRLSSDRVDLETRDRFRHDLDTWVADNRRNLLRALLLLVRAWYDRGQPEAPRPFGFKSFGEWQRIVGGVLHLAGINGFLSTVLDVREQADSEAVDNRACWEWIEGKFPVGTRFAARDLIAHARADPDAPAPYGTVWDDLDAKKLSMYFRLHARWYGDLKIINDGKVHGGGKAFVLKQSPFNVAPLDAKATSSSAHARTQPRHGAGAAPGETVETTNRRGFAQNIVRAMPQIDGKTIADMDSDAS